MDHRLAVADQPAEVKHRGHALERAVDGCPVAQVADLKLGLLGQEARLTRGMGLRQQVVENTDLVATREERIDQVRADEARATGDQDPSSSSSASTPLKMAV